MTKKTKSDVDAKRELLRKSFEESKPKTWMTFEPGDEVRVTSGGGRSEERRRFGLIVGAYPKFAVVQLEHYRESFGYEAIQMLRKNELTPKTNYV
jgi:uncharacterized protein Veg